MLFSLQADTGVEALALAREARRQGAKHVRDPTADIG